MLKPFFKYFVELTGNRLASTFLKTFTQSRISRPLLRPYAKAFDINEDEMEHPMTEYKSLHELFTRRLQKDARTIDESPHSLIAPVDGILSDIGIVEQDKTFFIKNEKYNIDNILGDAYKASPYANGYFYVFYLSPSHYHRIHYPINGKLLARYALGTTSYPVNQLGIRYGNKPFATNYRLISELKTTYGKMAIVKVGALNVNSVQVLSSKTQYDKGEELGYFTFGSTVLLFIEKGKLPFETTVLKETEIQMGQRIGFWVER